LLGHETDNFSADVKNAIALIYLLGLVPGDNFTAFHLPCQSTNILLLLILLQITGTKPVVKSTEENVLKKYKPHKFAKLCKDRKGKAIPVTDRGGP
jgi:hypothetical protein